MFESTSESQVGSAERKGSVSIINTDSSTKTRATRRCRRIFTNMKRPKTPRNLLGNLLQLNYYNTAKMLITINQTKASRNSGRTPNLKKGNTN